MSEQEIAALLNTKLPRDAIATRQQAGQTLAYVEAWYAIDQANQIFGFLNWDKHIHHLHMVSLEEVDGRNGAQWRCYYTCHLRVNVRHGDQAKYTDDVGYGSGISKNKGDAIEGAVKEAVSDAVKRCLKDLGNRFGLALYDKEKKGVETREEAEEKKEEPVTVAAAPAPAEEKPAAEEPPVPLKDKRVLRRIDEFATEDLKDIQMRDIFWRWLQRMQDYKSVVGECMYYEMLSRYKVEKSNQVDYTHPDGQRIMVDLSNRLKRLEWSEIQAYYNAALVTYKCPRAFDEVLSEINDTVEHASMIGDEAQQRALVIAWSKKIREIQSGKVARVVDMFDGEVLQQ